MLFSNVFSSFFFSQCFWINCVMGCLLWAIRPASTLVEEKFKGAFGTADAVVTGATAGLAVWRAVFTQLSGRICIGSRWTLGYTRTILIQEVACDTQSTQSHGCLTWPREACIFLYLWNKMNNPVLEVQSRFYRKLHRNGRHCISLETKPTKIPSRLFSDSLLHFTYTKKAHFVNVAVRVLFFLKLLCLHHLGVWSEGWASAHFWQSDSAARWALLSTVTVLINVMKSPTFLCSEPNAVSITVATQSLNVVLVLRGNTQTWCSVIMFHQYSFHNCTRQSFTPIQFLLPALFTAGIHFIAPLKHSVWLNKIIPKIKHISIIKLRIQTCSFTFKWRFYRI